MIVDQSDDEKGSISVVNWKLQQQDLVETPLQRLRRLIYETQELEQELQKNNVIDNNILNITSVE